MAAERVFTQQDQEAFAALSGDANPMHVDPVRARRLLLGKPVVHGIHALLWGLDTALAGREPAALESLDVRFLKPVGLDEPMACAWTRKDDGLSLEMSVRGQAVVSVRATLGSWTDGPDIPDETPPQAEPVERDAEQMAGTVAEPLALCLAREAAKQLFPYLCAVLPPAQLAGLVACSRVVGMRCPGLHSIFAGLKLTRPEAPPAETGYRLAGFDDRFSFATIDLSTPMLAGTLTAFLRPKPVAQPSYAELAAMVGPDEFAGVHALIVGGSRGLGEVAAKLLCAGGAEARITYHRGATDAEALCAEINAAGGACAPLRLDVTSPEGIKTALADGPRPTDLYYFASPPIFQGSKHAYSPELETLFNRFYVHGFQGVLRAVGMDEPLRVLYPSTVAVDEHPEDMREYATAKEAGETLCADLGSAHPNLTFFVPRFPRLATDQTASLYPVRNQDPAPAVLETLHAMAAAKDA